MDDCGAVAQVIVRWGLEPDGPAMRTHASTLVPVRRAGVPAMLKLAHSLEEARGGKLMTWWGGQGAAPVLARRGPALLMARATGGSLTEIEDDAATLAIVDVAGRLHARGGEPVPRLAPLRRWFRALGPAAGRHGGMLEACATVATELLDSPRDECALHGDLHHGNVLSFGAAGWLAIDPKGLWGERGFEFATLFRNPTPALALAPGRMARQVALVSGLTGIEPMRLLGWVAAVAGLSAAWTLSDGGDAVTDVAIARLALELRGE